MTMVEQRVTVGMDINCLGIAENVWVILLASAINILIGNNFDNIRQRSCYFMESFGGPCYG